MSVADFAKNIKGFTLEYASNHAELRRSGVSLASYVETAMRDTDPMFRLKPEEREFCDELEKREWGEVAEQSFSLAKSR